MKADERVVRFFKCKVVASVRVGGGKTNLMQPATLMDVLKEVERLIKEEQLPIRSATRDERMGWRIVDIEIDDGEEKAVILVNRSDADAANLAIENRVNGELRVAEKDEDEANAYSAHVIFDLKPKGKDSYVALIEQAGVSSLRVANLLSRAVRTSQSLGSKVFLYDHPDGSLDKKGNKRHLKGMYKFEISGKPSADLLEQLDRGQLTGVELVEGADVTKHWDTFNVTKERSRVVRLTVSDSNSGKGKGRQALDAVKNRKVVDSLLKSAAQENKKELVVRFDDEDGSGRTLTWDVESKHLLNEDRFVEREYIRNFSKRLDTGCESINAEVRDKMYYHLR